jgi:N6-L-threonylcarbamoyladenine synthase
MTVLVKPNHVKIYDMKILGIESSCDETAAAVVEDGTRILSSVVQSQIDIHAAFGGVVPEVAARSHLEVILPVIDRAVTEAGGWDEIDAVACTTMPGLVGSLLVCSLTARTLALIKDKPFYPIHHVEAHVYANFIEKTKTPAKPSDEPLPRKCVNGVAGATESPPVRHGDVAPRESLDALRGEEEVFGGVPGAPNFPMLALIVSGGHSQIVLFRDHGDYDLIGQTADDAVGEAFDKVAKILGLPYPGGPSIAGAAEHGDPHAYDFPKARMANPYDFSFSGLKTAVLRAAQSAAGRDHTFPSNALAGLLTREERDNFAASFQRAAVETLVDKVIAAYHEFQPASVVIAGGVAANAELRRQLAERLPIVITYPAPELCTDNAVMVASLGYFVAQKISPTDPRAVEVKPSISMTKTAWNTIIS